MVASSDLAISSSNLRKVYDDKVAVRGLSLDVRRGEAFGFLGPNGAGKSTSVKMLTGLVHPSSGSATVLGAPVGDRVIRARIGFLPEHFRFYDWLTPRELLRLHGELAGMTAAQMRSRIPEVLGTVGLSQHSSREIRRFSKGMLQRIGLAQAILNWPDLIFLDEPTSGLDPVGRRLVRDVIHAERERGAAVFLNSHLLSEVEATCDRVAFIRSGQVLETLDLQSLAECATVVSVRALNVSAELIGALRNRGYDPQQEDDRLTLHLQSADAAPEALDVFVQKGARVYEFTPRRRTLEDRFLEILGEDHGL